MQCTKKLYTGPADKTTGIYERLPLVPSGRETSKKPLAIIIKIPVIKVKTDFPFREL